MSVVIYGLVLESWRSSCHVLLLQNAHDNIICAMVFVGEHLFTASFSLIKVSRFMFSLLTWKVTKPSIGIFICKISNKIQVSKGMQVI